MREAQITPTHLIATVGLEAARALVEAEGGRRVRLPSLRQFNDMVVRNAAIWEAYRRIGKSGGYRQASCFYTAMAKDHRCSVDTVRRVVKNMKDCMNIVAPLA